MKWLNCDEIVQLIKKYAKISGYANVVGKQEERNRMTNLLQENIEKANTQIAHLIFGQHAKDQP
ncbi:MAG: hypothetical protein HN704_05270 [Bacteroidetes bacterium]|nr:hypothetical protein [Bacteroidota bacterium]MBT6686580.1 hypothetical protein [Bacteroidota bacterium]MBT7144341.1 hypothetical protein [Bacteroidota bacterium]MBT7491003.1 hypothetical protein [Bacteroidota bacterium]